MLTNSHEKLSEDQYEYNMGVRVTDFMNQTVLKMATSCELEKKHSDILDVGI
jgi:hypothetical protein